jgi:hypothetical protein
MHNNRGNTKTRVLNDKENHNFLRQHRCNTSAASFAGRIRLKQPQSSFFRGFFFAFSCSAGGLMLKQDLYD